jgi:DNA-binding NtrC family response regulator
MILKGHRYYHSFQGKEYYWKAKTTAKRSQKRDCSLINRSEMESKIIVIDDEQDFLDTIKRGLYISGYRNLKLIVDAKMTQELIEKESPPFDLALIDITMPSINGVDLLRIIKEKSPETECIMITAVNEAKVAVNCLQAGAYDYLIKPITREDLLATVKRALEKRKLSQLLEVTKHTAIPRDSLNHAFNPIISQSDSVLRVLKEAELHAPSDIPVLITGESGTGKELLAKAIHQISHRCNQTYTPVNMAAINAGLFEAEFLGHTKGAFTGSTRDRKGYLEQTDKGTLLMDEIGSTPIEFQSKLLRILQDGEFLKLGTSQPKKVDIRYISATNMDLETLMLKGKFRKDFFYRLKGAWLHLPPLRDRQNDIGMLTQHFLKEFEGSSESLLIDDQTLSVIMSYQYPGNIRELRSIIQYASNLSKNGLITVQCLPNHLRNSKTKSKKRSEIPNEYQSLESLIKHYIIQTYQKTGNNKLRTAKVLKIGINTLRRKLRLYGVK